MNAETVYAVTKALSDEEKVRLYHMLKRDFDIQVKAPDASNKLEFSDADALKYLYEKLF